jgi:hypothetical protein
VTAARPWLLAAGGMSVAASLLHLACILGGPDWYRFLGAGDRIARAAERGSLVPPVITFGIATMLAIWALYAFGSADIGWRPPLARTALIAISVVLIVRAFMIFNPAFWLPENQTTAFMVTTSAICLVMGACFAIGTWLAWPHFSQRT